MQASVRARCNHALEHAIGRADELGLPLVATFGLTDRYPEANARHYLFLLEGLADAREALAARGVPLVVQRAEPPDAALALAADAALVVTDAGYLRHQRAWRARVAGAAPCGVEQVETDAVVPVETASSSEAYSAAVLRPRIRRLLPRFLVPLPEARPRRDGFGLDLPADGIDVSDPRRALDALDVDRTVAPVDDACGGEVAARDRLEEFLRVDLARYVDRRNDPAFETGTSRLSAYLHFGHLSPLDVCLHLRGRHGAGVDAFVEQLVVRRELSLNLCRFNPRYDAFDALPEWARATLAKHARDPRPALYDERALETAASSDPYWNAAQREMVTTGSMHNTMRMYWGKKILEWTADPREAFRVALALNNRWQLDGRDPNSYAGVLWVFGKHDRPWGERPVFGTVRSMVATGLKRKYDIDRYVERWSRG